MNSQYITVQLASAQDAAAFGGQRTIRLALSPGDVSSVEEIDTYLPGYTPFGGYRGEEIAPTGALREKDTDSFRVYSMSNVFRRLHVEVSLQSRIGEVDPETTLDTYKVLPYGLGSFIPAETEQQSTYDVRRAAARRIKDALMVDKEARTWEVLTTLNNWGTGQRVTLGAGFNWDGGASSNPIIDIQSRLVASSQPVTGIYMGLKVAHAFLRHSLVRDHMRQMLGDNSPTPAVLAGAGIQGASELIDFVIPGFPPFHVAAGKVLNDTTGGLDEFIGRNVVMVSNPPGDPTDFERIQTVRTFRTKGPSGTGYTSREFQVDNRGLNGGRMLVAGFSEQIKMVANSAGGLIVDAIAA